MSSSTFNIIEPDGNDSITLVVGPDGTVSPDQEIVKSYLSSRQTVDINLMTMKKVEAGRVNVTLDNLTFVNSDSVEDPQEMDRIARNLMNFRMDHDYTPLTSPTHRPVSMDEVDDELAHTLSMLEQGSLDPQTHPEPLTKITKIVKGKKQTMFVTNKQKAKMISTGLLKERPSDEVFKKPKPLVVKTLKVKTTVKNVSKQELLDDDEDEDEEEEEFEPDEDDEEFMDDEDDSDFELEGDMRPKSTKRLLKRAKVDIKSIKIDKGKMKPLQKKVVAEKIEAEAPRPVQQMGEKVKLLEKKIQTPKKEKKPVKPIPDDFALFSTPDIIRRVGKEALSPEKIHPPPLQPKPAKISPESRSKSNVELKAKRLSTDLKVNDKVAEKSRRLSLDAKKLNITRRLSLDVKQSDAKIDDQVSVQEFSDNLSNESEPIDQLEPLPSAEDIRAIIQSENTKSFTTSLIIPEGNELASDEQTAQLNIEAGGLELDQSILDNINSDLISEDILYQVAQSLADNTELQNVIDKSIVDGNLVLDPSIQQSFANDPNLVQNTVENSNLQQQNLDLSSDEIDKTAPGTQIVRSDGRVVVIPPIERPATRSRNKRSESSSPLRQPKPAIKPLDEEHVSGNELDSSGEEEEEEESEDDPNKLWCICNQPHNNRFMICCDTCEEWYHGKCVNVTKAMGQMMEQEGKEWICIFCKDSSLIRPKAAARRIRKASRTSTDSASSNKRSSSNSFTTEERRSSTGGCVVCSKATRANSIYCSDNCILKHAQGVEKVVVYEKKANKTILNADKHDNVRSLAKPPHKNLTQSRLKLVKNVNNDGVSLAVQKKGINVGVLEHSPKEPPIILNKKIKMVSKQVSMNQHKVIKVISPVNPRPTLTSTPAKKTVQSKLPVTPMMKERPIPQKTPKSRQAEVGGQPRQENLRDTVRKTFFEQLSNRLKDVEDLKLTDDELKSISHEIESQLYKCFGDTGQKYRNKYRSLIFNIKDMKNQTLWRRICEKAVNPYQLVRLSPDDLASQELALWREREAKHQLDMIKKSELELLNCNRSYVFKTHKGEQVFEDDKPKDQLTEVISGLGTDNAVKDENDEGKDKDKKISSKHSKKDKERGRSRDSSRSKRSRDKSKEKRKERSSSKDHKKRSRSRERSRHEKKRSRSKDRHRDRDRRSSHKSSRHKSDEKLLTTDKLDKRSKEILEQLVDKHIVPPLEDKMWKSVSPEEVAPAQAPVESDSDHEPSSTVTIPTPPRSTEAEEPVQTKKIDSKSIVKESTEHKDTKDQAPKQTNLDKPPLWKGTINMVDVAQISITAHEVSGDCQGLKEDLPTSLDIVGRISPDTVWDYIGKMKTSNSKTISLIRLTATNVEEKMPYLALYSYLSSRNRLGVIKSVTKGVKDFYILPLAGHAPIPDALLPITGIGFEETRPQLLLGVIVRDKRKRGYEASSISTHHSKRSRAEAHSTATSTPPSTSRSYTPPPAKEPRAKITAVPLPVSTDVVEEEPEDDMDEPYSPEDSDPDTMPEPVSSHLNAHDISGILTGNVKTSSFLDTGLATQTFEPFSNKFDTIPGLDDTANLPSTSLELQRKMAELDQRIAAQKAEIDKVSQDLVTSAASGEIGSSTLANIALPSDLQQILESIKTIGAKTQNSDNKSDTTNVTSTGGSDLTIPLILPKLSSRPLIGAAASKADTTIPLKLPKTKKLEEKPTGSVLSSLSEEDLIKKAAEMLGESEPPKKDLNFYSQSPKRARLELSQPPIPGLEDE